MTACLLGPLRARRLRFADPAGGLDDSSTVLGQPLRRPRLHILLRVRAFDGPEPCLGRGEDHGQQIFGSHVPGEVAVLLRLGHLGGLVPERAWFKSGGGRAFQEFP